LRDLKRARIGLDRAVEQAFDLIGDAELKIIDGER